MLRTSAVVAFALLAVCAPVRAQEESSPQPERAPKADKSVEARPEPEPRSWLKGVTATLRVQLVISRYQGEKKTGSLPYAFVVTAGASSVRMRMGVDTPIPNVVADPGADGTLKLRSSSFNYKSIGTNIDCRARDMGDGRFWLELGVENSSAMPGAGKNATTPAEAAPMFRRFETSLNPLLRDGQTIQTIASTDPVTGEVVKIDVTLNVLK
jgi:hypothetical protein